MTCCWGDPKPCDTPDATEVRHLGALTSPVFARWADAKRTDQFCGIAVKSCYCERIYVSMQ